MTLAERLLKSAEFSRQFLIERLKPLGYHEGEFREAALFAAQSENARLTYHLELLTEVIELLDEIRRQSRSPIAQRGAERFFTKLEEFLTHRERKETKNE